MSEKGKFRKRFESFKTEEALRKKQADKFGNLRLIVFLSGAACVTLLFIYDLILLGVIVLAAVTALFVYLVIKHHKLANELKRLGIMTQINQMYMERMEGNWTNFHDDGEDFVDPAHPYTADLDIFGSKSLFQWLCIANTHNGRIKLKELLANPDKDIAGIKKRQRAVLELSEKLEFCQKLQCEGMLAKGTATDPEDFISYAEESTKRFKKEWVQYLFYLLPASTILTFVLLFLGGSIPVFIPILLLTIQMSICAIGYKRNSDIINTVYGFKKHLDAFGNLLQLIEREEFADAYLSELRQELFQDGMAASGSLKKLESITNAIDIKLSTVLYFILNFGLLWDYHCVFALEDWKKQYGRHISRWLETVGQMEAYASLAVPKLLYPEWIFPDFSEKGMRFSAVGMGHPLIQKDACVCNDFELNHGACVITGSNMSGKTTLLRTVGISLVLAYSGAPVFAQKLECSVMNIFTSMRVHDDLNKGISTFYAELLRIKMIIDYSYKEVPMIYLIDEIFMGTNSPDRIAGAETVLKNLSRNWIIGLISTHDFELCDLENDKQVKITNYHFTEKYVNNEIRFDYKIRSGRSKTTNAKYLMKMVGIE